MTASASKHCRTFNFKGIMISKILKQIKQLRSMLLPVAGWIRWKEFKKNGGTWIQIQKLRDIKQHRGREVVRTQEDASIITSSNSKNAQKANKFATQMICKIAKWWVSDSPLSACPKAISPLLGSPSPFFKLYFPPWVLILLLLSTHAIVD